MSDFQQPSSTPPLPSPGMAPPPPPATAPFGVPPAPQHGAGSPYGYVPQGYVPLGYPLMNGIPMKPPRPPVKVGSLLLIGGGLGLILGSFLTWFSIDGSTFNGFSEVVTLDGDDPVGGGFVVFAVLLVGFGIAQLAARKVLAVAILAVVFASFTVLVALGQTSEVSETVRLSKLFGTDVSWGPGVPVLVISSMVGLGGAIATLAKRRRHAA